MKFLKKPFKKALLFMGIMSITFLSNAQNYDQQNEYQTLFGNNMSNGGYGSFSLGFTQVGKYQAFYSGIKGAWVIGHGFALGIAGNAFATELNADIIPENEYNIVGGGYGGLLLEPIIWGNKPVHFSIPIIIGAGAVAFETGYYDQNYMNPYDFDQYFVLEPGLEVELNITRFFRIGVGGSYRFTTDVDLTYTNTSQIEQQILSGNDLNKFNTYISFKFGRF